MQTRIYPRNMGKNYMMKTSIAVWCSKAKKGDNMIVSSMLGDFVLEFKGKHKPRKTKIVVVEENL